MHVREIVVRSFKRFTELIVQGLPSTTRLVVMTGPNGCGKSSLFDAMGRWYDFQAAGNTIADEMYYAKAGLPPFSRSSQDCVRITFFEPLPQDRHARKKLFYIRSAYRNEADFRIDQLSRVGDHFDAPRIRRLIDNDARVKDNYQRLVSHSVAGLYSGEYDGATVAQLREMLIGRVRDSMSRVFDHLNLRGPGDPLRDGSFFFEKGVSRDFHYKNLSGGEKAAFDLLLDFIVKRTAYDDTVFCIDEPEMHMHTRLQAKLLEELFHLVSEKSQLWIATHSIGMMRKARDLQREHPDQIVFLDFHDHDFDQTVLISPKQVDRAFWHQTLGVALDDLAQLVAPKWIILCEGRPLRAHNHARAEFDARCYRSIFAAEFPETDFLSVGSATEVQGDALHVGSAIQTVLSGTKVLRLIDRDDRSEREIKDLASTGVRVLTRRHIEAYLLDDEILTALCLTTGHEDKIKDVLEAKRQAIAKSIGRGNPADDVKSAEGDIYTEAKRILGLKGCGSTPEAFILDMLVPLITPSTKTYLELRRDVFET